MSSPSWIGRRVCRMTGNRPALRTLLVHDDAAREFDYTAGAEQALERAHSAGWTVISVNTDWAKVFADDDV